MTSPAAFRTRLKPLLLMLTAPTGGERQNAVAAIERVLAAAGLVWHELATVLDEPKPSLAPAAKPPFCKCDVGYEIDCDGLAALGAVIGMSRLVNDFTLRFLEDTQGRANRLDVVLFTDKQARWRSELRERVLS